MVLRSINYILILLILCSIQVVMGQDFTLHTVNSYPNKLEESLKNSLESKAFQIIDDLLDFVADQEKFGKKSFNDLREGKLTFPMIYTREVCTPEERAMLERVFNTEVDENWAIGWIEALLERYQTQAYCLGVAQEHADRAKSALVALPDRPARHSLRQLADYVVSRDW